MEGGASAACVQNRTADATSRLPGRRVRVRNRTAAHANNSRLKAIKSVSRQSTERSGEKEGEGGNKRCEEESDTGVPA